MPKTIALKGEFIRKEVVATGAVTPGMQVGILGAVAGANFQRKAFALENDLIGGGIDDAYATNDLIQYGVFPPGAEVYAWLASGQNVVKGAKLQGDGAGRLTIAASGEDAGLIAYALEAVDASGGAARIRAEIA